MAEVFLAKRTGPRGFEKKLVIKRILPHLSASPAFTEMFRNEARLAALVDHPNVVHVSGFGEVDGTSFLAMEYVDGVTVAELLRLLGVVPPGVAARIGIEVLEGLYAIHTLRDDAGRPLGLVHRDVGSRNVMVTRAGSVKLLDFGIAVSGEGRARPMGTRVYMSPEQRRSGRIDARSDLYSTGALLIELLTGEPPREQEGAIEHPPGVPAELFDPIRRALSPDPEDRPVSARDFSRSLELFLTTRGLEGTVSHLGELVEALAPQRGPVGRAVERLTRLTRSSPSIPEVSAAPERPAIPWSIGAALVLVAAGSYAVTLAVRSEPEPSDITEVTEGAAQALGPEGAAAIEAPALAPVVSAVEAPALAPAVSEEMPDVAPASAASLAESGSVAAVRAEQKQELTVRAKARSKPERRASQQGRLTIDTQPWTEVYFGGRLLGVTPLSDVELPVGELELELRNPEMGLSKRLPVRIRADEVTRVKRAL